MRLVFPMKEQNILHNKLKVRHLDSSMTYHKLVETLNRLAQKSSFFFNAQYRALYCDYIIDLVSVGVRLTGATPAIPVHPVPNLTHTKGFFLTVMVDTDQTWDPRFPHGPYALCVSNDSYHFSSSKGYLFFIPSAPFILHLVNG